MKRTLVTRVAVLAFGIAALAVPMAVPAAAHHSGSMFDPTQTVIMSGTVKELQWTNPHSYIWLYKNPDKAGVKSDSPDLLWSVELTSPGNLKRMGWDKNIVKPGDKITVSMRPNRSGSHGGGIVSLTLPNGTVIQHDRALAYRPNIQ